MGIENLLGKFGLEVEWEDEDDAKHAHTEKHPAKPATKKIETKRGQAYTPSGGDVQIIALEPTRRSDAKDICDELKNGNTVVINVEKLPDGEVVRLLDIINGAAYVLGGKIKDIAESVFVIAPYNVDIQTSDMDKPLYEEEYD
jgi:cell division inhibitor SepF